MGKDFLGVGEVGSVLVVENTKQRTKSHTEQLQHGSSHLDQAPGRLPPCHSPKLTLTGDNEIVLLLVGFSQGLVTAANFALGPDDALFFHVASSFVISNRNTKRKSKRSCMFYALPPDMEVPDTKSGQELLMKSSNLLKIFIAPFVQSLSG